GSGSPMAGESTLQRRAGRLLRGLADGSLAVPHLARGVDAKRLQKPQVLEVDPEGGALAGVRDFFLRLRGRQRPDAAPPPGPPLALVHADLRVEDHVEVVALVTDLLDRVVHAPRARDRLVDRLTELLEHRAKMIGEFHGRSDYRFRFRKNSRIFPTSKRCY